jgi:hypothetical protein
MREESGNEHVVKEFQEYKILNYEFWTIRS